MQQIGHDLLVQRAVFVQEFLADVLVKDQFAIVELGDCRVRLLDLIANLVIGLCRSREDSKDENLHLRPLLTKLFNDRFDAAGDLLGGVRPHIVRADHDDSRLRRCRD